MKLKACLSLALAAVASSGHAQPDLTPDALIGTCQLTARQASGARVSTLIEFRPGGQFGTATTVDGRPLRTASGTWRLVGRGLEWTYLESSHLTVAQGPVVVDDIQSLDADQVTLRSRASGQVHVCQRVRYDAARPTLTN